MLKVRRRKKPSRVPKENTIHPTKGHQVCGAKNKSGGICLNKPDPALTNGRCRFHGRGGLGPVHAHYSQLLPENVADLIHELSSDTLIADLSDKIATLQIMLTEKMALWANKQSIKDVDALMKPYHELSGAILAQDMDAIIKAQAKMGDALMDAKSLEAAETSIRSIIKDIKDLAAVQNLREAQQAQVLNAKQVNALILALTAAVVESVGDPQVIRNVERKFVSIIGTTSLADFTENSRLPEREPVAVVYRGPEDQNDGEGIDSVFTEHSPVDV